MANVQKLAAGGVSSYTTCGFAAGDTNSLANANYAVATGSTCTNATNLDLFAEISFIITVGGTTTAGAFIAFYLLPQNQDATTYGDEVAGGATSGATSYIVATVGIKVGITTGNTIVGTTPRFSLPRGVFKFALANNVGVAFNSSSAATISYRTYNFNLNG